MATRAREPNEENWAKLRRLLKYIRGTMCMPLILVNTLGKAGAQIPQLPLGDDSSPWGI
jgi:hypothetical protein